MTRNRPGLGVLLSVLAVGATVGTWFILTEGLTGIQALAFPSPTLLWAVVRDNWQTLLGAAGLTSLRVVVGCLTGGLLGVVLALLCARWPLLYRAINPLVEVVRPIPPIALTPFFIFWFGLGTIAQINLVALGSFMILFVTTTGAIGNIDPIFERAYLLLGGKRNHLAAHVWLPASLPEITSAVRVTIASGFALTVAAEYLGAQGGLGYIIRNARVTLDTPSILAAALLLGICSYAIDIVFRASALAVTSWVPRTRRD